MSLDHDLKALLTRTADAAGTFSPPSAGELRARARRRSRGRSLAAVAGAVVIVVALSLVLALRPDRGAAPAGASPRGFDPSQLPGPTGPAVTAAQLLRDHWTGLPVAPIVSRSDAAGVWTGSQLIIWGGSNYGSGSAPFADGAAYDPATRTWTKLPPSPLSARTDMAYAWAGGRLVIWGGDDGSGRRHRDHDGAAYDPITGRWTMLPRAPISAYTAQAYAVGSQVVLVSSVPGKNTPVVRAAAYNPASNRWTRLPELRLPSRHEVIGVVGLGVGPDLFIWPEWGYSTQTGPTTSHGTSGVDSYVLANGSWSRVALKPLRGDDAGQPAWTGRAVILAGQSEFCGFCLGGPGVTRQPSVLVDLSRGTRHRLPTTSGDYARFVWVGGALLGAFEGDSGTGLHPGGSVVWSPTTDRWTELPQAPFTNDGDPTIVWTGRALLVWGGDLSPSGPGANFAVSGYEFGPP